MVLVVVLYRYHSTTQWLVEDNVPILLQALLEASVLGFLAWCGQALLWSSWRRTLPTWLPFLCSTGARRLSLASMTPG